MSELSRAQGGDAPPFKLLVGGKTYNVGLVTKDVKVAYEKELFRKTRESLAAFRGDCDADMYERSIIRCADTFAAGDYAMEGKVGQKILGTPRGSLLVLSLIMGVEEDEVVKVMLADEAQVMAVFRAVLRESFPGVDFAEGGSPDPPKATAG